MRKLILYIAISLDGFIANPDGNIDWLNAESEKVTGDFGYQEFYDSIDTILLGNHTYQQIITELSPDHWVYEDKLTYVWTHQQLSDKEHIKFIHEDPAAFIKDLKEQTGSNIWLNGGAQLIDQVWCADLIDELQIAIMPVTLGCGMSLFPKHDQRTWNLKSAYVEGNMLLMRYTK